MTHPENHLVILRRIYLDITGNHCAAKLINFFMRWRNWKLNSHRTDWVYMPLRKIHDELMGEHSLHVIRAAIALLEKLGFIKKRQNPGNGQDKTYQYQLQVEAIDKSLSEIAECDTEIPECETEHSENNVEQHTQITTTEIQNTSITPTKKMEQEKSFSTDAEQLVKRYEASLKAYGVYPFSEYVENGDPVKNPKFKPIFQALTKVSLDRAERSIMAYLGWIKNMREDRIGCKYKALHNAIARNWQSS